MSLATPAELAGRVRAAADHRVRTLPVLVLMPHAGCDCRCAMCDIWRAHAAGERLAAGELAPHLEAIARLRVRRAVLSGGEALLHPDLWTLCDALRAAGAAITLLSSGLELAAAAPRVVERCAEVVVSLDGPPEVHDAVRRIPRAFERLAEGVAALRAARADFRVCARCTVQRANFRRLAEVVETARGIGLDGVSFLAADVDSTAFGRPQPWSAARAAEVAPGPEELPELERALEALIGTRAADLASGYVAESAERLRDIGRHFRALHGRGRAPRRRCNAPWVSAVVEADGRVRPCFFQPAYGRLDEAPLDALLNSEAAVAFRRGLDVARDPICRRCVCTLRLPLHRSG